MTAKTKTKQTDPSPWPAPWLEQEFLDLVRDIGDAHGEGVAYELIDGQGETIYREPLGFPDEASAVHFAWVIHLPEQFHARWTFEKIKVLTPHHEFTVAVGPGLYGNLLVVQTGLGDSGEIFRRLTGAEPKLAASFQELFTEG